MNYLDFSAKYLVKLQIFLANSCRSSCSISVNIYARKLDFSHNSDWYCWKSAQTKIKIFKASFKYSVDFWSRL